MTEQTIKIEGLPEGWMAKEFRLGEVNEAYYDPATKSICRLLLGSTVGVLIVEKIKPRRIVLEETEERHLGCQTMHIDGTEVRIMTSKVWIEVKETDVHLTSDEPKLSLSVCECQGLFEGNQPSINKVKEFIKENS